MKQKSQFRAVLPAITLFLFTFALFQFLYQYDNKYSMSPPYGKDGVFQFSDVDMKKPLFLIDGWELYPDVRLTPEDFRAGFAPPPLETFIGQYTNFSYLRSGHSPFGIATYRIVLRYDGTPRPLLLTVPEIFTDYTLWADGVSIAQTGSGSSVIVTVGGDTELVLSVENRTHYYSGLFYPPAIGTTAVIQRMFLVQNLFYGFLCAFSLALCLFAYTGRARRDADPMFLHFGLLCLFFAIHCAYPFLRQLGYNSPFWYAVEDTSWLLVLYETVMLCTLEAGLAKKRWFRLLVRPLSLAACVLCFVCVTFLIPAQGSIVAVYGGLLDRWKLVCWLYLLLCAVYGWQKGHVSGGFLLSGGAVLGAAQLVNLLDNNRFEPIYAGWQTEYAGFLLVLIFWGMVLWHIRALRLQNQQLTEHLEDLVQKRTEELGTVLEERKNFFSDMAHNLKAPIAVVHNFIALIRDGNLYLDDELRDYISQIESGNTELQRRVESLSALNSFDRINVAKEWLDVDALLQIVFRKNEPEVGVMGIHFQVNALGQPAAIFAQREKLLILFENLIYNAISFTPADGSITITPWLNGDRVVIEVADTGSGIAPEHLPHIFDRFYTVREKRSEGSGLGLYICKLTVEELGGSISASSIRGKGAVFTLSLPIVPAQ